jgi:hypothetical protein
VRQAQLVRLGAQQGPVGDGQSPLGRPQADEPLQLVERAVPLDPLAGGPLGVVGGPHGRVAQQRLPQGRDLIEVGLERVLVLGIAGPRRPLRLAPGQGLLQRLPIGRRLDS